MKRASVEPVILAIDLGTSSVRCALFDHNARRLARSSRSEKYRLNHLACHGAELDPAVLLRATKKCLRPFHRLTTNECLTIAGSGFWHSLLGVDRNGQPLTPIYTWADARCAPDAAQLRTEFDEGAILQRTGCMLRASFWPAKLIWLRRTQPKIFRRAARWISPAEWIFEKIFGIAFCSRSMASGTGLYNFKTGTWDQALLERIGLTNEKMNPLRDQVENHFPALGDGAASNLGSGATAPGVVAINVGTSAAVRTIPAPEPPLPMGLFRYVVNEERALFGGAVSNAGNLHAWCRRVLQLPPNERAIDKMLRASSRETSSLTILPFWVNERAPSWPENLDGAILGLTQATTAADLLRATTAAVCHRLADIFDQLEHAVGRCKKIIVSGGILQSPASLQILANSLGRSIVPTADQEASLRGAAVHALEQLGKKVPPPKLGRAIHPQAKAVAEARRQRRRQIELEHLLRAQRWS